MIIDIQRFATAERKYWTELEHLLEKIETDPLSTMDFEQAKRFHYLYQRTSADLARIMTFASEPEIRSYLESLVARAYGEIHETRTKPHRLKPLHWFFHTLPQTFRRHIRAFWLSLAVPMAGCVFGALALSVDPDAKQVIMGPFGRHLMQRPSERVAEEEKPDEDEEDPLRLGKMAGTAFYMTHNTKVSITALAFGITWGVGTILLLLFNGILLGAVAIDYILSGETAFLIGWLLPHGAIEIPAILIAGQAGLVLGSALIGWGTRRPVRRRLRAISGDLVTLIFGVAILLTWAGFVEAFLSQYHEPVIPYALKISFGVLELVLLVLFLSRSGAQEPSASLDTGLNDAERETEHATD
jgi:uncharacterized membrane protein SpoIIM required for sporulation